MSERLDALLSAKRDGAFTAAEQTELDRLLAESEAARTRARKFERVDAGLCALTSGEAPDARLAQLARVRTRLEQRVRAAGRRGSEHARKTRWRLLGWGMAAAAMAAGIALAALVLGRGGEHGIDIRNDAHARERVAADDLVVDEEFESLGIARAADLEVIEELELLEFLADRERAAEAPRG